MGRKIFVGNLSWGTTEHELTDAFSPCGVIDEVKVVRDRATGRSRGFGFITFSDESSVHKAIQEMDGLNIEDRPIRVGEASEKRR